MRAARNPDACVVQLDIRGKLAYFSEGNIVAPGTPEVPVAALFAIDAAEQKLNTLQLKEKQPGMKVGSPARTLRGRDQDHP